MLCRAGQPYKSSHAWPSRRLQFESLENRRLLSSAPGADALKLFSTSTALFVENEGQWQDKSVRYGFNGPGVDIAFTDEGLNFLLTQRDARETDASDAAGLEPAPRTGDVPGEDPADGAARQS